MKDILMISLVSFPQGDINYCPEDDFSAECPAGEVIVITEAKYGRMERGRCVKRNYGYLGCSMTVLAYVDAKCSGRRSCTFSVFESLRKYHPCPSDISSYLQAKYTCLKGEFNGAELKGCDRKREHEM